jgi:hypothetical protein
MEFNGVDEDSSSTTSLRVVRSMLRGSSIVVDESCLRTMKNSFVESQ